MNAPLASAAVQASERAALQSRLVQALKPLLPAHALLWNREDTTPYECDGLTAYRQRPLAVALPEQSRMFGFPQAKAFTPDRWLRDGDTVCVGQSELQVRHCPGHTPGHVVFYSAQAKRAFVGDVLFAGSIGRTDFPRGDHATLIASIRQRLWPMGEDTVFIPGHGPESTFGRERQTNPYVADGR